MMSDQDDNSIKLEYLKLEGLTGKYENVIFVPKRKCSNFSNFHPDVVLYFGGDMQNFSKLMIKDPAFIFENYSLESIAQKLSLRFETSSIVVVQPTNQFQHRFSCFDNFYSSNDQYGTPSWSKNEADNINVQEFNSFKHLEQLIVRLTYNREGNSSEETNCTFPKRIALITFSKGGCVAYQLIVDMKEYLSSKIELSHLYLLDIGHNGERRIWLTDESTIESLSLKIPQLNIHIGTTAFQLEYKQKFWIKEEMNRFIDLLKKYKLHIKQMHLDLENSKKRTCNNEDYFRLHFQIIDQLFEGNL